METQATSESIPLDSQRSVDASSVVVISPLGNRKMSEEIQFAVQILDQLVADLTERVALLQA